MQFLYQCLLSLFLLAFQASVSAAIYAGVGKANITPPVKTPSAGYLDRKGEGMEGVHDPLLATALFLEGDHGKQIVLCGVDHLGFSYDMVQQIIQKVQKIEGLQTCDVYIGSSHTHSGGGAYLNIPGLGESLAGTYQASMVDLYVDKTVEAVAKAYQNRVLAKVGIGYGKAEKISQYRGSFPKEASPLSDIAVIKVVKEDGSFLAVWMNYPMHPTVLTGQNRLFSADFVGYARDHLQSLLGFEVQPIYFNGAQGDIIPLSLQEEDRFAICSFLGLSLAKSVKEIVAAIEVSDHLQIATQKLCYSFKPEATPYGLLLPVSEYKSEMNLLVLNKTHAFLTVPGELSCLYDYRLKKAGKDLGFAHVSILGLTQDAHGYIILPSSWKAKTYESRLSFGGEFYGEQMEQRALELLKTQRVP